MAPPVSSARAVASSAQITSTLRLGCACRNSTSQATLGSKIKVGTVHGKKVVLKIPQGTQSGTRFRIKGQGIAKGEARGDQYVEAKVHVPDKLSEEEQRAMEEFAEATGLKH